MSPASLLSLPAETLDAVCALVADTKDLLALSRACRVLGHVAQRRLFRHVSLHKNAKRGVLVLARDPRLALHVRTFELAAFAADDVLPAFVCVLARALANMRAVTSVVFSVAHLAPAFAHELHHCFHHAPDLEFPQLRTLVCDLPFDSITTAFLERCPALLSLQLGSTMSSSSSSSLVIPVSPSVVPRLEALAGPADAALALVPGRPVSSVQLLSPDALHSQTVAALARSSVNVAYLDAVMTDFSLSQLALVGQNLGPTLENLRIAVLNAFASVPDATFLSPVADILDTFPDLWSFELSGIHWASSVKPDAGGHQKRAWQREPLQLTADTSTTTAELHGDSLELDDGWGFDVLV